MDEITVEFMNEGSCKFDKSDLAVLRSRLMKITKDFMEKFDLRDITFVVTTKPVDISIKDEKKEMNDFSILRPETPKYSIDDIILSDDTFSEILNAINLSKVKDKVFFEWNISKIEPFPKIALNFHGKPGTGKTMTAHAVAHAIKKKIILASYADIESKYHGDGPKNVKKIFQSASEEDAVLFIDEADSLLSHRLTNVTQGSEQAINSMRSQLLIEIEQYKGIVIFATNFVQNYDEAFSTRVKNIHFELPRERERGQILYKLVSCGAPISDNVDIDQLSKIDKICGRDLKNAFINAAIVAAIEGENEIKHEHLKESIERIVKEKQEIQSLDLSIV